MRLHRDSLTAWSPLPRVSSTPRILLLANQINGTHHGRSGRNRNKGKPHRNLPVYSEFVLWALLDCLEHPIPRPPSRIVHTSVSTSTTLSSADCLLPSHYIGFFDGRCANSVYRDSGVIDVLFTCGLVRTVRFRSVFLSPHS